MNRLTKHLTVAASIACAFCFGNGHALATETPKAQDASILVYSKNAPIPLILEITPEHSAALGLEEGKSLHIRMAVETPKETHALVDNLRKDEWFVELDHNHKAMLRIHPNPESFSGILKVTVNGHQLPETPILNGRYEPGRLLEKNLDYVFPDGTRILIHYTDQDLELAGAPKDLPFKVRDAAVNAYQIITGIQGFQSTGYSFSDPDTRYAYDPDKTIDIFLGSPDGENRFSKLGWKNRLFKDSPCFDTIPGQDDAAHNAVILLPTNYHQFIRNWEKMNPSSLGKRNIEVDLRGTLIHEMLHAILFYYNKNLNKPGSADNHDPSRSSRHLDWYVEGLARYFETMAGAKHDFFSQGFKESLPDKIRFSRGGSNYFMRYPDQAFTDLRYENALFWRFLDYRFGMETIERLSREFRREPSDFRRTLEKVTGIAHEELLTQYARAILLNDFGLKDESAYLQEIAITRLELDSEGYWMVDGFGKKQRLGRECDSDWIGRWGPFKSALGKPGVAGDHTTEADISAWASDFIEITPTGEIKSIGDVSFVVRESDTPVIIQVFAYTKGGSILEKRTVSSRLYGHAVNLGLSSLLKSHSVGWQDIQKICLVLTNTNSEKSVPYELRWTN